LRGGSSPLTLCRSAAAGSAWSTTTSPREMTASHPLPRIARLAMGFDLIVGSLLLVLGAFFTWIWLRAGEDPHGGIFSLLAAAVILMGGVLLLLTARALRLRQPGGWFLQSVSFLYVSAFAAFLWVGSQ
jgi:predicted phage tail protein